jgi:EasF-like predicted methyltransferase
MDTPMYTPPHTPVLKNKVEIIDICSSTHDVSLLEKLEESLSASPPSFPSLLLWDEKGLQHFEAVTHSPEYYLTNCEIELLKQHSEEIARDIAPGSIVLELGSGCLRKIKILLDALEAQRKAVSYYALDLNRSELERTLTDISPSSFRYVKCYGLLGTYDDALRWLQQRPYAAQPKCILSLGSTIGSMSCLEAARFLRSFAKGVKRSTEKTMFVIGVDGCQDGDKVWRAYNDSEGHNYRFISNILRHANRILGYEAFDPKDWKVEGDWNVHCGSHDQFLVPQRNLIASGVELRKGMGLYVVSSYKFDDEEQEKLWESAGLELESCWRTEPHGYALNVLSVDDRP